MRNRYKRDINRLVEHPRRFPESKSLRAPGALASGYSSGSGLTRTAGTAPVELAWRGRERGDIVETLWEYDFDLAGAVSSSNSSVTSIKAISQYGADRYAISSGNKLLKNGAVIADTDQDLGSVNDVCAVKNQDTGFVEVWVSGQNVLNAAVVYIYDTDGSFNREFVLPSGRGYAGGYAFMAVSPNFHIWGDNNNVQVKRNADNTLVRDIAWCSGIPHEQTGLLDITDTVAAVACESSVKLSLVSDGSAVPLTLDTTYLNTYSQGIIGIQLTDNTVTVFGASRFIHYEIQKNATGVPTGTQELDRAEYSTVEQYNLNITSDRLHLKSAL